MDQYSYNLVSGQWCSTDMFPQADRTDAWEMALTSAYRDWTVKERVSPDFTASMRQRDVAGLKLIECVCSPCSGIRSNTEIKRDNERYLGIQVTTKGSERFKIGDDYFSFGGGDLVLWVSDQETEFVVTEDLHKTTLMIPLNSIQDRIPKGVQVRGSVVDSKTGLGAVLFNHILTLSNQFDYMDMSSSNAIKRATLELVSALISKNMESVSSTSLSYQYLMSIQNYILDHLQEEDLNIGKIAQANRISVRYLHMIFEQTGQSVSAWIKEQRLKRCLEALKDPAESARQVSEIAFKWGFNDASHFSRAFKIHFGQSPKSIRTELCKSSDN